MAHIHLLHKGLEPDQEVKNMVEFLNDHTPELTPRPSGELRVMAELIRAVLVKSSPDDLVVAVLKQIIRWRI